MKCERCKGTGKDPVILLTWTAGRSIPAPCIDCGGTTFTHCCEGLCEQPEPEKKDEVDNNC